MNIKNNNSFLNRVFKNRRNIKITVGVGLAVLGLIVVALVFALHSRNALMMETKSFETSNTSYVFTQQLSQKD